MLSTISQCVIKCTGEFDLCASLRLCVSVCSWTGQPHSVCLFHKGDEILAINDLHAGSVEEVNSYLSKSLKNEVNSSSERSHVHVSQIADARKEKKPKPNEPIMPAFR